MIDEKSLQYLDDMYNTLCDKSLTEKQKQVMIRTQWLAMLLKDSDSAKGYMKLRDSAANDKIREVAEGLLKAVGMVVKANMKMYQTYGADYKALVSVLNADYKQIEEIEKNGDQELPFDELILKYGLADKHYPEIREALILNKGA